MNQVRLQSFSKSINISEAKKTDYAKKFKKKIELAQKQIDQAKKDEISAIETDSTWESIYDFESIELKGNRLIVKYTEPYNTGRDKDKVDVVDLKTDERYDFEEARYMFQWIAKTIKKGYKSEGKQIPNIK